ncbi:MAG TPA: tRNA preQ1(34) S-adenosylmethionine ribosyltransferase-isomerase QueA [Candidatus Binatia bacterium]|nr:tRNA preQ1(34) S-adenosylmethionine ribosyltransferase-isomerase QueA [Candidatus Binatia bacterium]
MQSVVYSDGAEPRWPLSDFEFDLPPDLIAQEPASDRAAARLLVWDRRSGERTHTRVHELTHFLRAGDVLVFNDTKVVPARIYGRTTTGAAVELLLIRPNGDETWQCLGRPRKRLQPGAHVSIGKHAGAVVRTAHPTGRYDLAFDVADVSGLLQRHGEVPLPPYIKRPDGPLPFDRERYQTVFAARPGAVAAPTAGLHFTPALLDELRQRGAEIVFVTLHVGPGTFLPVHAGDLSDHHMDAEWCEISATSAERINSARRDGRRVVAVGTTTTRALESSADSDGRVVAGNRWADRFIRPGDHFQVADALFTNFHLPGSTLLALVSAFAGREPTLAVYREAVTLRYRFYSYGDAMFIQ